MAHTPIWVRTCISQLTVCATHLFIWSILAHKITIATNITAIEHTRTHIFGLSNCGRRLYFIGNSEIYSVHGHRVFFLLFLQFSFAMFGSFVGSLDLVFLFICETCVRAFILCHLNRDTSCGKHIDTLRWRWQSGSLGLNCTIYFHTCVRVCEQDNVYSAFFWNEKYYAECLVPSSSPSPSPSPPPLQPPLLALLWMTLRRFCVQLDDSRCHPYGWWFLFHFRLVDFVGRRQFDADKMRAFWSTLMVMVGIHIHTHTTICIARIGVNGKIFNREKKHTHKQIYLRYHLWYVRACSQSVSVL